MTAAEFAIRASRIAEKAAQWSRITLQSPQPPSARTVAGFLEEMSHELDRIRKASERL